MAHRDDERLAAAWIPESFADAVHAVAKAAGVSKSEVIRRGIAAQLLSVAEAPSEEPHDGG